MNVVILWHMHQPYYVNPMTKRAMMPWVRFHAAKGYLDMIDLVADLPELRVNFNFTPVLVRQILELVEKEVVDDWEELSRKPAAELTLHDKRTLLENFFKIHWDNLVRPYPRYAELLSNRGTRYTLNQLDGIARRFSEADFRDLQTLYNLHWCGFSALRRYPHLAELKAKGRNFTEAEKISVLDTHHTILSIVLGEYRKLEEAGRIEITTTPYFHPIMPLVYDTQIARRCQPHSPLPTPFSAPEDVRAQLRLAQELHEKVFGQKARGVWPSEGSMAPEIVPLLQEAGLKYFCTDEGNLFKSLEQDPGQHGRRAEHMELFQGWNVETNGGKIMALFRDRPLSDFVGFDAARNETSKAISHLIDNLKNIASALPESGREDAVVPLILDGENAWEAFPDSGEAFLSGFYKALLDSPELKTQRLGDHFKAHPPKAKLTHLHSGSWIRSDFDIWIGDPEENQGWEGVREARKFLTDKIAAADASGTPLPKEKVDAAWWEIYAAEGSDWFWWYGPDFTIDTDFLFDELFRLHLQNVYIYLGVEPPVQLHVPICLPSVYVKDFSDPTRLIEPAVTGDRSRFFDWTGCGELQIQRQQTAMFQSDRLGLRLLYGFGTNDFYIRLDQRAQAEAFVARFLRPKVCRLTIRPTDTKRANASMALRWETSEDGLNFIDEEPIGVVASGLNSLIVKIPRNLLGIGDTEEFAFFIELMESGLLRERYPERGAVEIESPGEDFEAEQWLV